MPHKFISLRMTHKKNTHYNDERDKSKEKGVKMYSLVTVNMKVVVA